MLPANGIVVLWLRSLRVSTPPSRHLRRHTLWLQACTAGRSCAACVAVPPLLQDICQKPESKWETTVGGCCALPAAPPCCI